MLLIPVKTTIAYEHMIALCQWMKKCGIQFWKHRRKLNEDGLRVLLVAIKEIEERPLTYSVTDENNLILTGFIGFLDPAKPSAKPVH